MTILCRFSRFLNFSADLRGFKICFKLFFHNAVKLRNLKIVKISATILKFPFSVGFFAITLPLVSPGTRVRTDETKHLKLWNKLTKSN